MNEPEPEHGPERGEPGQVPPWRAAPPPPPPPGGTSDPALARAGAAQAWGMACHLSTLVTYCFRIAWLNLPGVVAPVLLWQLLETRHPRAAHHAKEAFNFQLNVLAWLLVAKALSALCCLGNAPVWAVTIANVVLTLAAAVQTAEGERYRYPFIVRVLDSGS